MKIGAWIHDYSGQNLEEQVRHAATAGIRSVRSYHFDYSRKIAPLATEQGMTLMAGIPVDSEGLVKEWSSQVRLDDLQKTSHHILHYLLLRQPQRAASFL